MSGETVLKVVVVGIEGEINLGFIVRLCKNFEVDELALVSPQVDPWSDEVRRFAAHGAAYLDEGRVKVYDSLDAALSGCGLSGCTSAIVGQEGDILRRAIDIEEFAAIASRYSNVAIVFGRESVGLTREEISKCDLLVHIPASPTYPTLNLSHAVAIALYVLYRRLRGRSLIEERLTVADEESLAIAERYITKLATIVASDERQLESMALTLKRLIKRATLTRAEVGFITTFFRRVAQQLEKCLTQ